MTDTTTILALVAAGGYALAMGTSAMWLKAASDTQSAIDKLHRHASVHRDLEVVAAAERSRRTSKGNRTRYAKRRALVAAKTAELAEAVEPHPMQNTMPTYSQSQLRRAGL